MARATRDVVEVPTFLWESLLETVDALADRAELESIRRGLQDIRAGRILTKAEFLRRRPHLSRWGADVNAVRAHHHRDILERVREASDREVQRRLWKKVQVLETRFEAGTPLVSAEDPTYGRLYRLRVGD